MDTNNKTLSELQQMYDGLRESIRHTLSGLLMDTDLHHSIICNILLDYGAFGLSTNQIPSIDRIYQEPSDGIIWLRYKDSSEYVEFDMFYTEDLMCVLRQLTDLFECYH